jgi:hypothetical protein
MMSGDHRLYRIRQTGGAKTMKCFFDHTWGWPRKRGGKDMQVCLNCGAERESKVRFDGPRYRKTQDGVPNFSAPVLRIEQDAHTCEVVPFSAAA